jgi:DNA-binding response OmpR family regulator
MNAVNRLLIVDDDRGLVTLLKRFLEGEGFRVDAAYDHASGLTAALSGEHELIILDVMLPGGTGFELLKALRQQSRRSGRSHPRSRDRRRRLPGQAFRSA